MPKKVMEIQPDIIKLNKFLSTRRNDQTRKYTRIILEGLRGGKEVDIRSLLNELVPSHIPNESTFFRIIKDLSDPEWGILERREDTTVVRRGKSHVFYKLNIFLPWEGGTGNLKDATDEDFIFSLFRKLIIAKDIIAADRKISQKKVDDLINREYVTRYTEQEHPDAVSKDKVDS